MSYEGSYMWGLRQKAGDMLILTATIDVIPIDQAGRIKLVYASHFDHWSCVGGHAEPGDSWRSAAQHELEEEAGIIANKEDLIPFGTISGPGRVFQYQDGITQAFTMSFYIKKWSQEIAPTDREEVTNSDWFTIDEALKLNLTPWARDIIMSFQRYQETGEFQMIEVNSPEHQKLS